MVTALETGKVEAICIDEPVIKYIMATEDHAIDYITEPIEEYNYGFAFPKTEKGRKLLITKRNKTWAMKTSTNVTQ